MLSAILLPESFTQKQWAIFFVLAYILLAVVFLGSYIHWTPINWILGSLALYTAFNTRCNKTSSLRYLFFAILFAMLYLLIPAKTFLFAMLICSLFLVIENFVSKLNYLPAVCVVLLSPITEYLVNLFSFPIRLFLTSVAGAAMRLVDSSARVEGNMIITDASEFSVDPACMGLHMLLASLIAGMLLINIISGKLNKTPGFLVFVLFMLIVFLLNIVSNLFRIVCLVLFDIGSDSLMHGLLGLICIMVYVLLPAIFLSRTIVARYGKPFESFPVSNPGTTTISCRSLLLHLLLPFATLAVVLSGKGRSAYDTVPNQQQSIPGFHVTLLPDGISKFEKPGALIYYKPIIGFYASDHQPMICWRGSGFEFRKVQQKIIAGHKIYVAELQKGDEVLYTAWWYSGGDMITSSQLAWRWNAFKTGARYMLVNVTTSGNETLKNEIQLMLK